MKIYVGHSSSFDFKKYLYEPLINSDLNKYHNFILPHKMYTKATDFITRDIIKTCDIMIAEVSYPATGLGIELGWADVAQVPIICVYKKDQKISDSLRVVTESFIEYIDASDMINKINDKINK